MMVPLIVRRAMRTEQHTPSDSSLMSVVTLATSDPTRDEHVDEGFSARSAPLLRSYITEGETDPTRDEPTFDG